LCNNKHSSVDVQFFSTTKLGAAVLTRDITLIIPETLEIIRKPVSATSQSVIKSANNTGLLNNYGIKKHNIK